MKENYGLKVNKFNGKLSLVFIYHDGLTLGAKKSTDNSYYLTKKTEAVRRN